MDPRQEYEQHAASLRARLQETQEKGLIARSGVSEQIAKTRQTIEESRKLMKRADEILQGTATVHPVR